MIEVPHQPVAERIIARILDRERPPQQFLLFGPAGTGKHRTARALAWKLLDPTGSHDPDEASLDLSVVTTEGASIRLEADLEPALKDLAAHPIVNKRRVLIIDGAERLREQDGAPRILKSLEEPPPRAHLILITDHVSDLLPTIRSRCIPIPFRSPGWTVIAEQLVATGVDPEEATALARAQGTAALSATPFERAMRRIGVQLATDVLEGSGSGPTLVRDIQAQMEKAAKDNASDTLDHLIKEAEALAGKRGERTALKRVEDQQKRELRRLSTDGWGLILDGAAGYLADALNVALGSEATVRHRDRLDALRAVAPPSRVRGLQRAIDEVQTTRAEMELNPTLDLAAEALITRMSAAVHGRPLPPLIAPGRLPV